MTDIAALVADNLAVWTGAVEQRASAGRGGGKRISLYGIERLRALILDLAVRGKLVPQDPGNEPASVMLKNLRQQRARNRNARKTFENSSSKPFNVPASWEWVHVSDVGHDWGSVEPSSEFTYIDVGAINQNKGVIESPSILSADEAPSRARRIVKLGTVLYSTVRPYLLNIAVVDRVFDPSPIASTAFAVIQPYDGVIARYIYHYLRSPTFVAYVEGCQAGIAYPAINDRQFFSAWFPLPPLTEQQRIVAKVDELMTLCDGLEEESAAAQEAHQRLGECLLATLVDSLDATDLAINWSRLEAHFDILFTTDESIEALKRTVRELAVRGKLVPQDPGNEPASVMLKNLRQQRARNRNARKTFENSSSKPFNVPASWEWVHVSDVGHDWGSVEPSSEFTYIDVGAINQNKGVIESPSILSADEAPSRARRIVKLGTVLYSTVRPYLLNIAIVDRVFDPSPIASTAFAVIQPYDGVIARYIYHYLRSPTFVAYVEGCQAGIAYPAINDRQFFSAWFPLPPLTEQQRIVAKVDELMTLCDSLKASLADASETQKYLAGAIVEKAAA